MAAQAAIPASLIPATTAVFAAGRGYILSQSPSLHTCEDGRLRGHDGTVAAVAMGVSVEHGGNAFLTHSAQDGLADQRRYCPSDRPRTSAGVAPKRLRKAR